MSDKDLDEQFAAIVAHWDEAALGVDPFGDEVPDRRGPAAPDEDPGALAAAGLAAGAVEEPDDAEDPDADIDELDGPVLPGGGWRTFAAAEAEEHFEPPPPAPLPSGDDKHFWAIIVGLVGGPLLLVYLILFNRDGNGWWMFFALLVSIAGFVLLVLRRPADDGEDDDGVRL